MKKTDVTKAIRIARDNEPFQRVRCAYDFCLGLIGEMDTPQKKAGKQAAKKRACSRCGMEFTPEGRERTCPDCRGGRKEMADDVLKQIHEVAKELAEG